jgi:hypothetical protein
MLNKRVVFAWLLLLSLVLVLIASPVTLAQTGNDRQRLPGPDLAQAIVTLGDLPVTFEQLAEEDLAESAGVVYEVAALLDSLTQGQLQFPTIFRHEDPKQYEVLVNLFLSPLNRVEQAVVDVVLSDPSRALRDVEERLGHLVGSIRPESLPGTWTLGDKCAALTTVMNVKPNPLRVDAVIVRRDQVLSLLWSMRVEGTQPALDVGELSTVSDERVAEAVALGRSSYRPTSPLVPELTTYIPTPLDVSTDPEVVNANLRLAVLATVLLVVAQEAMNQTLSQHEDAVSGLLRPLRSAAWVQRLQGVRLLPTLRPAIRDMLRFVGIVVLYGLITSLLDPGWKPFTMAGVFLFVSMALANGLIGMADDLAQWFTARRWGLTATMRVRPGNLFLAVASTLGSRILSLVPGIWFGAPEAFEVDSPLLDEHLTRRLLFTGLIVLVLVGATVWLLSGGAAIASSLLPVVSQAVSLPANASLWLGGIQSFLLLAFATVVQTIFLDMIGLPDTVGQALLRSRRWLWGVLMLGATFLFCHTLLNPQLDLATALEGSTVRVFVITIAAVTVLAVAVWLYFGKFRREPSPPAGGGEVGEPSLPAGGGEDGESGLSAGGGEDGEPSLPHGAGEDGELSLPPGAGEDDEPTLSPGAGEDQ